jgi:hypothetical protein
MILVGKTLGKTAVVTRKDVIKMDVVINKMWFCGQVSANLQAPVDFIKRR